MKSVVKTTLHYIRNVVAEEQTLGFFNVSSGQWNCNWAGTWRSRMLCTFCVRLNSWQVKTKWEKSGKHLVTSPQQKQTEEWLICQSAEENHSDRFQESYRREMLEKSYTQTYMEVDLELRVILHTSVNHVIWNSFCIHKGSYSVGITDMMKARDFFHYLINVCWVCRWISVQ